MTFTTLLSIALGIGLAASAGFRVFLPLFALSLSAYFGLWPVNENWQWLASTPALIILGVATVAERLRANKGRNTRKPALAARPMPSAMLRRVVNVMGVENMSAEA